MNDTVPQAPVVKEEPRLYELATDLTAANGPEVSDEQHRANAIGTGLRVLAEMFEANPDLAAGFAWSLGEIRDFVDRDMVIRFTRAALRHGAMVDKHFSGNYAGVRAKFGPVEVTAFADRDEVCERVVTGTREVTEQVPDPEALKAVPLVEVTRTVEDVEWRCRPLLDASARDGER